MYVLGKCVRDLGDITTTRLVFVISGGWKPAKSHISTSPASGTKVIALGDEYTAESR